MDLRHPRQTPVLTRTEGSFNYQGVSSKGGFRLKAGWFAVWILAAKLPKSDLNFAVDFLVDFSSLFAK